MIGRRSGRSSDGADTVAKQCGEGGIRGYSEQGELWGVTGLNYPKGLPSIGSLTRFGAE